MFRKKKFIIGGAVLGVALIALLFNAFQGGSYYYTIKEIKTGSTVNTQQKIRVIGEVMPGSVEWSAQKFTASFTISDKDTKDTLPVVYAGALPDNFAEGMEVIVEGNYSPGQPFRADQIVGKCASKYSPS